MTLQLRESGPEQLGRWLSLIGAAVFCWLGYAQRRKPEGWHGL
jgi:threonine/homoserine/homoserine lactone efflux protein